MISNHLITKKINNFHTLKNNYYTYEIHQASLLLPSGISATMLYAQEEPAKERETGHVNQNKFRQMYNEFATPNMFRTASGAPGPAYYQQQADYKMDIELDDKNMKLYGLETITYHNNSPDNLEYLWVSA